MTNRIERVIVGDIQTNCYLYQFEDTPDLSGLPDRKKPCVIIDPGDEAPLIQSRLSHLNWIPYYIILTHGHFDHLAALPDLAINVVGKFADNSIGKEGKNPKIAIHRLDAGYLGKDALKNHRDCFSAAGGDPSFVDALWKPLPQGDILFEEGDEIGPFRIIHLPGHTPGSVGLYDQKAGLLFSGDTLFKGNCGRTDLPGGNWEQLKESLKRLLSIDEETLIYPGHGPMTSIKAEKIFFR